MKKCIECGIEKSLNEFYRGSVKCKKCVCFRVNQRRLWLIANDPVWVEKEAERQRIKERKRYQEKKALGKIVRAPSRIYRSAYPEKYQATKAVSNIEVEPGFNKHHWSYKTEHHLDVIILKQEDHYFIHRFIRYDREQMCYKIKATGEMLDTRDKHESFIQAILHWRQSQNGTSNVSSIAS